MVFFSIEDDWCKPRFLVHVFIAEGPPFSVHNDRDMHVEELEGDAFRFDPIDCFSGIGQGAVFQKANFPSFLKVRGKPFVSFNILERSFESWIWITFRGESIVCEYHFEESG